MSIKKSDRQNSLQIEIESDSGEHNNQLQQQFGPDQAP